MIKEKATNIPENRWKNVFTRPGTTADIKKAAAEIKADIEKTKKMFLKTFG